MARIVVGDLLRLSLSETDRKLFFQSVNEKILADKQSNNSSQSATRIPSAINSNLSGSSNAGGTQSRNSEPLDLVAAIGDHGQPKEYAFPGTSYNQTPYSRIKKIPVADSLADPINTSSSAIESDIENDVNIIAANQICTRSSGRVNDVSKHDLMKHDFNELVEAVQSLAQDIDDFCIDYNTEISHDDKTTFSVLSDIMIRKMQVVRGKEANSPLKPATHQFCASLLAHLSTAKYKQVVAKEFSLASVDTAKISLNLFAEEGFFFLIFLTFYF